MKKVLFVDCCIRRENSRTKELADYFISALRQKTEYEVETLCLMDENLSYFSDGFFEQRERLLAKGEFSHPRFRYAREFAEADKIVIAAPLWDLSFPALLKVYIENLCVDGITFGCGAQGLEGKCKADQMVYITTRGGSYGNSPLEMGSRYMEAMSVFFGIDTYTLLAADGMDEGVRAPEDILKDAKAQADEILKQF